MQSRAEGKCVMRGTRGVFNKDKPSGAQPKTFILSVFECVRSSRRGDTPRVYLMHVRISTR